VSCTRWVWDCANARQRAVRCEMGVHEVRNGGGAWPRFQKAGEPSCDPLCALSRLSWQDGSLAASRQLPDVRANFQVEVERDDIEVGANDFLEFCMTPGADRAEETQGLRLPPIG